MDESKQLLKQLSGHFPVRLGTLKVYGDWFGRPMDNVHTAVGGELNDAGDLVLQFDEGERLIISDPRGCSFELASGRGARLRIERASRVRWEWYYYGRPRAPENLFVEEHWISGNEVLATSTANWYEPKFAPSLVEPAVEFW